MLLQRRKGGGRCLNSSYWLQQKIYIYYIYKNIYFFIYVYINKRSNFHKLNIEEELASVSHLHEVSDSLRQQWITPCPFLPITAVSPPHSSIPILPQILLCQHLTLSSLPPCFPAHPASHSCLPPSFFSKLVLKRSLQKSVFFLPFSAGHPPLQGDQENQKSMTVFLSQVIHQPTVAISCRTQNWSWSSRVKSFSPKSI